MIDDLRPMHKAIVSIFLYTGMRRNKVLGLKVTDINFEENYIYVQRTLVYGEGDKIYEKHTPKTNAGVRKIPMIPALKNILVEYTSQYINNEQGYLFLTRNGTFITNGNFCDKWKRILKKVNKYMPKGYETNISPHYFRHNFATELVYANIPLKTVQYIMGHENINMTMNIYTDVRMNNQEVINNLSQYI